MSSRVGSDRQYASLILDSDGVVSLCDVNLLDTVVSDIALPRFHKERETKPDLELGLSLTTVQLTDKYKGGYAADCLNVTAGHCSLFI